MITTWTTPPVLTPQDGVQYWRDRVIFILLLVGVVLGFFVCIASVVLSLKEALWSVAAADTAIYLWMVILFFKRTISFRIRAVSIVLSLYIIGMILLLIIGPYSAGPVWIFAFPVIAAALMGLTAALVALSINAATLVILGVLISFGYWQSPFTIINPLERWSVIALNFILLDTIVTLIVIVILQGLQNWLEKEKTFLASLEQKQTELIETNRRLHREIADRERTEILLRESEELFRTSLERAPDGIYMNDLEGNFLYGNLKAEEIIGYRREELLGKNFLSFRIIADESLGKAAELLMANREGKSTGPDELTILGKEGRRILVEITTTVVQQRGQSNVLAFVRDITERRQIEEEKRNLEERLQRAEKMEALGTMAGGVAHDLNNVLGIVVGFSELLLNNSETPDSFRPHLLTIMDAGERAAAIVQDLLTLARRGVPNRQILNLNRIVTDCQKLPEFEKLISYHSEVRIKADLEPDLLNISGSPVHLSKTLFNLISNASEAMPNGGTVVIKTANEHLEQPIQGYDEIRRGDYVLLSVSDTGEGIPEADLKRIFEPFYTKKVMGRSGTGLGLSVVWGTVKDHLGYINVQSRKGKGCTFTLYFPATREEITAERSAVDVSEYKGCGESILVVDDVQGQRELAAAMLRKLNYRVETVSSGEEALAYLKKHRVDLLVLDMIMNPGMDGLDTYRSALEIHPNQKAIIVSGFSETERVNAAHAMGAGTYVKKPYIIEKLGLAVKKELERAG